MWQITPQNEHIKNAVHAQYADILHNLFILF